jgi:glutamine synthetase
MAKLKLEYLWLDGYKPVPNLRGKTKVADGDPDSYTLADCPMWGFDGSSTQQAEGKSSDCMLKPIALYPDTGRENGFIVMCEVMMPDGVTPHPSNTRATVPNDETLWIGLEQEYFLYQNGRPLGWPKNGFPNPQGEYYCGAGFQNVGSIAREIVEEHLDACIDAGINHEGINAEVAKGQWEFQIFGKGAQKAADQIWVARYLLARICEKYGVEVDLHCKPFRGDWNGSGMHCNFSTEHMRTVGGEDYFLKLMGQFEKNCEEHIAAYGPDNHLRLTGLHETQSIDKFSWGVADRGASVRVPHSFIQDGHKGYLEDRRPNSQADPYAIVARVAQTIAEVPTA